MNPASDAPLGVPAPTVQTARQRVAGAITALFVPGDRPDRFAKAARSAADVVIIDLEDAVAAQAKPDARAAVVDHLASGSSDQMQALVRINAAQTPYFHSDVQALIEVAEQPGHGLLGIMLAQAEDPTVPQHLAKGLNARAISPLAVVPLVESAVGLINVLPLARATA